MTSANSTATFSGDNNQAFQLGHNHGHISNTFNLPQPERSQIPSKPCSTVPFRRDRDFVDRGGILSRIGEICSEPAGRAALVGLGGVGKSQLAIEYSYRLREKSPQTWVFWVHAGTAARFEEGYRRIAEQLKLPRWNEPKTDVLQLVCSWLWDEANGNWMIILDSADDPAMFSEAHEAKTASNTGEHSTRTANLSKYLPQTRNGSILVTSRSRDVALRLTGDMANIVAVEPMDKEHALTLFQKKVIGEFNEDDATSLLYALDYMPLAITQAAAYISQRAPRITVSKYLDLFRRNEKNKASLLDRDAGDLRRDPEASNSIITTLQISFNHICKVRPSATELLSLMSLFDRQGIPESLLRGHKDDCDCDDDPDSDFGEDVFMLQNYSLVTANVDGKSFEMHRLVQFSMRKWIEAYDDLEKWKEKYIEIMVRAFPYGKIKNWATCRRLFPHAEAVLEYCPSNKGHELKWAEILDNAGWYASEQGISAMAERMSSQALNVREKLLGKEHMVTLLSCNNLGMVLVRQGRYNQAEELHQRALEGREKVLGPDHRVTLASVNNLGLVLHLQGRYKEAEKLHRRALEGTEKLLGKDDPLTLASINNLAAALKSQGGCKQAEELYQQALEGQEKVLGIDHPDTLASINGLASLFKQHDRYEEAEEMLRQGLEGSEKLLGKDHPDTLQCITDLAVLLQHRRKNEEAEELYQRAMEGREKVLGKDHPKTLQNVHMLATVLHSQRRYAEALVLYKRAYDGYTRVLKGDHPDKELCKLNYSILREQLEQMNKLATSVSGSDHDQEFPQPGQKAMERKRRKQIDGRLGPLAVMSRPTTGYSDQGRRHEVASTYDGIQGMSLEEASYPAEQSKPKKRDKWRALFKKS